MGQKESALKKVLELGKLTLGIGGCILFGLIDEFGSEIKRVYYKRKNIQFREYTDIQGIYHVERIS